MKPRKRDAEKVADDLAAMRERLGLVRVEEWNGLVPGGRVRLKNQGTGNRVLFFRAHYTNILKGTEWVDVWDPDMREVRPVRPEFVVKCRRQPADDLRKRAESPAKPERKAS